MTTDVQFLSVGAAARYLGLSTPTLRLWDMTGRLRAYRTLGGHRRYLLSDLERVHTERLANQPPTKEEK